MEFAGIACRAGSSRSEGLSNAEQCGFKDPDGLKPTLLYDPDSSVGVSSFNSGLAA